jgi:hypothetical protein
VEAKLRDLSFELKKTQDQLINATKENQERTEKIEKLESMSSEQKKRFIFIYLFPFFIYF